MAVDYMGEARAQHIKLRANLAGLHVRFLQTIVNSKVGMGERVNPHIYVQKYVKGDKGPKQNWQRIFALFELFLFWKICEIEWGMKFWGRSCDTVHPASCPQCCFLYLRNYWDSKRKIKGAFPCITKAIYYWPKFWSPKSTGNVDLNIYVDIST